MIYLTIAVIALLLGILAVCITGLVFSVKAHNKAMDNMATLTTLTNKFASLVNMCSKTMHMCSETAETQADMDNRLCKTEKLIDDMEKGIVPDFEAARKAKEETDKFMTGVSNIFGFDPMEQLRKSRKEKEDGDTE